MPSYAQFENQREVRDILHLNLIRYLSRLTSTKFRLMASIFCTVHFCIGILSTADAESNFVYSNMAEPSAENIVVDTAYYNLLRSGFLDGTKNTFEWARMIRKETNAIMEAYEDACGADSCHVFHYGGSVGNKDIALDSSTCQQIVVMLAASENDVKVLSHLINILVKNANQELSLNILRPGLSKFCDRVGVLIVGYGHGRDVTYAISENKDQ